ncbi:class III signal peptide-containing protein [Candidatus Micrarchaeota archaeon]|nr:class III signal peptide-containing protein [Candidatus Micrarchaeota archaeon]
MKGQVSAEMLIMLAVVVAVVAIAATYLVGLGKDAGEQVQEGGHDILESVEEASKGDTGEPCLDDDGCKSGNCDTSNRCT